MKLCFKKYVAATFRSPQLNGGLKAAATFEGDMLKKWLTAAVIFSIFGCIAAGLSLSEYFHLLNKGFEEPSYCAISETLDCTIVNASSYATLLGVPTASWGLAFYFVLFCFSLYARLSGSFRERTVSFAFILSLTGLIWSLRMAYVSAFILHTFCITCLAQYIINILLAVILYFSVKAPLATRFSLVFSKKAFSQALTTGIIFGIVYVFSLSAVRGAVSEIKPEDVEEVVNAHFGQSLYDIPAEALLEAPVWGNPNAKVTIVEFSDFQCPFCRVAAFNIKPYLYEFKDKVKFIFLNYPLDNACNKYVDHPMHQNACMAARAGVCAQMVGKFWEYHDDVFKNQRELSRETLEKLAAKNGIDKEWFDKCLSDNSSLAPIQADIETAHHIYIQATPSVFVNHRLLRALRSPDVLRAVVKKEIKKSY